MLVRNLNVSNARRKNIGRLPSERHRAVVYSWSVGGDEDKIQDSRDKKKTFKGTFHESHL